MSKKHEMFCFVRGNNPSVDSLLTVVSVTSRWFSEWHTPLHINGIRCEDGKKPRVYVDYTPRLHNLGRVFLTTEQGERRSLLIHDGGIAVLVYWTNPPDPSKRGEHEKRLGESLMSVMLGESNGGDCPEIPEPNMTMGELFSVMQRPPVVAERKPNLLMRWFRGGEK